MILSGGFQTFQQHAEHLTAFSCGKELDSIVRKADQNNPIATLTINSLFSQGICDTFNESIAFVLSVALNGGRHVLV